MGTSLAYVAAVVVGVLYLTVPLIRHAFKYMAAHERRRNNERLEGPALELLLKLSWEDTVNTALVRRMAIENPSNWPSYVTPEDLTRGIEGIFSRVASVWVMRLEDREYEKDIEWSPSPSWFSVVPLPTAPADSIEAP